MNSGESLHQYLRLERLTFIALAGCFLCLIPLLAPKSFHLDAIQRVLGVANLICFGAFAFFVLRLSYFRCPRCSNYFSRGKVEYSQASGKCCRHCGLKVHGGA
jgi:hypothetical protein